MTAMLADRLKEATGAVHARAERSGFINRILRGKADLFGYSLLLRNLCAVYSHLELALDRRQSDPIILEIRDTRLYRTEAARRDLDNLAGPSWGRSLPILASAWRYMDRIAHAEHDPSALLAHAYTRYLGDVNGGQVVKKLLRERTGVPSEALRFFAYPQFHDVSRFAKIYRRQFDIAGMKGVDEPRAIEETELAFELNIALSEEVDARVDERRGGSG